MTIMSMRNLLLATTALGALSMATAFLAPPTCTAAAVRQQQQQQQQSFTTSLHLSSPSPSTEETEVERLLRKARELREQASQDEQAMHQQSSQKKSQQHAHYDSLLDFYLCGDSSSSSSSSSSTNDVVNRLHQKQVSMETLEHLVDRLDEKHAMASGKEHVNVDCQRIKLQKDEQEMQALDAKMELLLSAVQVLDDEFREAHVHKKKSGGVAGSSEGSLLYSVSAAEASHWGGGHAAKDLRQRWQEKRREREEQFLKRQEEINDAQRIKKNTAPPPKVKDDHGFLK